MKRPVLRAASTSVRVYLVLLLVHLAAVLALLSTGDGKRKLVVVVFAVSIPVGLACAYGVSVSRRFRSMRKTLEAQNESLRLILAHVAQGVMTIDLSGHFTREYSSRTAEWLGEPKVGETLVSMLERYDAQSAAWMRLGLEEVRAGTLPLALTIDQLPKRVLGVGGRPLQFEYRIIGEASPPNELLVLVSDVTAERERSALEVDKLEALAVFEGLVRDQEGFLQYVKEASRIAKKVVEGRLRAGEERRAVHTLKGIASVMGSRRLEQVCHAMEEGHRETGSFSKAELDRLRAAAAQLVETTEKLSGASGHRVVISRREFDGLVQAIRDHATHEALLSRILEFEGESAPERLESLAQHGRVLARWLEKDNVLVTHQCELDRLPRGDWHRFFFELTHVIRNAVDHGIELPEERIEQGKPVVAHVTVSANVEGKTFVLEIADDGRGIDFEKVRERARNAGLASETKEDLVDAIFSDGLSTRENITTVSGRGVGLSAVRVACVRRGGTVLVHSEVGKGTRFTFRFPISPSETRIRAEPARKSQAT